MVEKIREGTINVLGLDLVRTVKMEHEAVAAWVQWAEGLLAEAPKDITLQSSVELVKAAVKNRPQSLLRRLPWSYDYFGVAATRHLVTFWTPLPP